MQNEKTNLYHIHQSLEVLFTHHPVLSQRFRTTSTKKQKAFDQLWVSFLN